MHGPSNPPCTDDDDPPWVGQLQPVVANGEIEEGHEDGSAGEEKHEQLCHEAELAERERGGERYWTGREIEEQIREDGTI